jgi:hypothetical protein
MFAYKMVKLIVPAGKRHRLPELPGTDSSRVQINGNMSVSLKLGKPLTITKSETAKVRQNS